MTAEQIKYMVDRFLNWRLPEDFRPDAGISFKPTFNDHFPVPMKHEPKGTNLFDAIQATAMVQYMVEGMPPTVAGEQDMTGQTRDDGGPAFPIISMDRMGHISISGGMALRDWYAGQALSGIRSGPRAYLRPESAARVAYKDADAMLAERKK